jgi:hypothetical protein
VVFKEWRGGTSFDNSPFRTSLYMAYTAATPTPTCTNVRVRLDRLRVAETTAVVAAATGMVGDKHLLRQNRKRAIERLREKGTT